MERIYLAGPEVFLPNASDVFQAKKILCSEAGYEGVSPFDSNFEGMSNDHQCGLRIAKANEDLIDSCSIVIANITPWQGLHADVGTCIEIGYARAKGKRVFAYTQAADSLQITRLKKRYMETMQDEKGFQRDAFNHVLLEDFGMVDNLMIEGAIHESGGYMFAVEIPGKSRFVDLQGFCLCLDSLQSRP